MKITIPENLSEITLAQYQKYNTIEGDEYFLALKSVEVFCGLTLKEVNQMRLDDVTDTLNVINEAFTKKRKSFNHYRRFFIGGVEYGFIPDLENISMGEFIDISSYLGDIENMNKLMAVLYRPITNQTRDLYSIEDYEGSEKYSGMLKNMPLDVALEGSVFFWTLANELLSVMKHSSDKQVMKVMDLVQKNLLANVGDGMEVSGQLQTETS